MFKIMKEKGKTNVENKILLTFGGGVNSYAILIEAYKRGIKPDLILFADTGNEKPHTYQAIIRMNTWLLSKGWPQIHVVSKDFRDGKQRTLYDYCYERNELPSIAYGFKTCSLKWKAAPIDKFCNHYPPFKEHWKAGGIVERWLGIDYGEDHRVKQTPDDMKKKYVFRFPLVEWEMDRADCEETIKREKMPMPGKSSCFFCPSSRKSEVMQLKEHYPMLAQAAVDMEKNAELTKIAGLGRNYAWQSIYDQPDMFGNFLGDWEMPCDCFD